MKITKRIIDNSTNIGKRNIKYIVMHYALTNSFDTVFNAFLSNGTSAHYCAGENGNVVQYVDETLVAWHAGEWEANCDSIGVETLCYLKKNGNPSNSHDWLFSESTLNTLAELYADIAKRLGWSKLEIGLNVKYHSDCSATSCPGDLRDLGIGLEVIKKSNDILHKNVSKTSQNVNNRRYGYRVDDLQNVNGIWQVKNDMLGEPDFNWTENGINVAYIDKINPATGKNTKDQVLKIGDYFSFQPSSIGIITEQYPLNGKIISHVQFPDEFIWLYTQNKDKLIYG